jgi:hypothetical protein
MSYITGKLRTQFINFSSNSSLQLMVYKNTTVVNKQQLFLSVVTRLVRRHAEAKDRMPQPARRNGIRAVSWRDTHERDPSKPQL